MLLNENLNKLFTVLGRKFKFSAEDSDLEYLWWQCKISSISSDIKPPLEITILRYALIFSFFTFFSLSGVSGIKCPFFTS